MDTLQSRQDTRSLMWKAKQSLRYEDGNMRKQREIKEEKIPGGGTSEGKMIIAS